MGDGDQRGEAGIRLRRLRAPIQPNALTKLAVPAGPGLPSRAAANEAAAIAAFLRGRIRAVLVRASHGRSLARMLDAIDALGAECAQKFETALAQAAARDPARGAELRSIACRRGCAFCCHVEVDVTPLEAIRLARRAPGHAAAPAPQRHAPCPLLVEGACSQYEARPYACRAVFSPDAGRCEQGFLADQAVAVPSLDWPRYLASGYITGEIAALDDLGLASHMVVLRRALAVLSADPDAVPRWLNGADIFPRRA
ncbi:MAG TPA: YkgJ family cysteine cluster protein [Stellaceae bacterium]|nr:YkgJ family cysteine cluster protein [Stellaceae bacterium]